MAEANAPPGAFVTLSGDDGTFDAFWSEGSDASAASLILLHEIFGVTDKIRRYAADFASAGLSVLVPDLFWRFEPRAELGHDEDGMRRALARLPRFDDTAALRDIATCARWLRARRPHAALAMVGFCLGGKLVVEARMRGMADCYVAYYGVGIEKIAGDLGERNDPLLMHHGATDDYAPPSVVNALLSRLGTATQVHFYDDAGHAFYRPWRDDASRLSRERSLAFIAAHASRADGAPR